GTKRFELYTSLSHLLRFLVGQYVATDSDRVKGMLNSALFEAKADGIGKSARFPRDAILLERVIRAEVDVGNVK
ncbi:MAG TPA: hypothetical protein VFO36_12510, partial [Nitrospiraceae bacterium]|nr:hypothetical protein [Nitrospiraceae bacterium]